MIDEVLDDEGMAVENLSLVYSWASIFCGVGPLVFLVYFAIKTIGPMAVNDSLFTVDLPPLIGVIIVIMPILGLCFYYAARRRREPKRRIRITGLVLNILTAMGIYGSVLFAMFIDYNRGL